MYFLRYLKLSEIEFKLLFKLRIQHHTIVCINHNIFFFIIFHTLNYKKNKTIIIEIKSSTLSTNNTAV